jgi:hypothetical protein
VHHIYIYYSDCVTFVYTLNTGVVIFESSHPVFYQLLLRSGRSPAEAMMMLVPEAYKNHPTLSIKYPEVWNALVNKCWACMKSLSY